MAYRIKTVAELTGIPRNTILAWERRYELLQPERAANGYRLFSESDIALLAELRSLVDGGLRISEAVSIVRSRGAGPVVTPAPVDTVDAFTAAKKRILRSLLAFDRGGADRARGRLTHVPFRPVLEKVLGPVLIEVGYGWERGVCSVAQEHFATAWVRDQIVSMLMQVECGPVGGRLVACATPPGETHEIGVLALAVRLALLGHRVAYLGPDLPLDALSTYAESHRPETVCLSVTRRHDARSVERLALDVRAVLPDGVGLVLGGGGVPVGLDLGIEGVRMAHEPEDVFPPRR